MCKASNDTFSIKNKSSYYESVHNFVKMCGDFHYTLKENLISTIDLRVYIWLYG